MITTTRTQAEVIQEALDQLAKATYALDDLRRTEIETVVDGWQFDYGYCLNLECREAIARLYDQVQQTIVVVARSAARTPNLQIPDTD